MSDNEHTLLCWILAGCIVVICACDVYVTWMEFPPQLEAPID